MSVSGERVQVSAPPGRRSYRRAEAVTATMPKVRQNPAHAPGPASGGSVAAQKSFKIFAKIF